MENRAPMRVVAAIATGFAGFVVSYLLLTALLVAMTPPDVGAVRQVAGLVATLAVPATIALWLGGVVARWSSSIQLAAAADGPQTARG